MFSVIKKLIFRGVMSITLAAGMLTQAAYGALPNAFYGPQEQLVELVACKIKEEFPQAWIDKMTEAQEQMFYYNIWQFITSQPHTRLQIQDFIDTQCLCDDIFQNCLDENNLTPKELANFAAQYFYELNFAHTVGNDLYSYFVNSNGPDFFSHTLIETPPVDTLKNMITMYLSPAAEHYLAQNHVLKTEFDKYVSCFAQNPLEHFGCLIEFIVDGVKCITNESKPNSLPQESDSLEEPSTVSSDATLSTISSDEEPYDSSDGQFLKGARGKNSYRY